MITDEEISQLPEDPQLAFVEVEKIIRARLREKEDEATQEQYGNADSYRLEYMNKVLAAARVYEIEALKRWDVPQINDNIDLAYRQLSSDVDHFTMQIRLRQPARGRENSVGLDGSTKIKIHHHISQIRAAIEAADLPESKRDSLYSKLNRFAEAVDKARTDLQAGMAVYIAVCDGIGEGFKKLEPARRWIDSIAALLGRAKEAEDSLRAALPRPAEHRQLEAPRKALPAPDQKGDAADDEIPF
jgi:hypothetical protein